MYSRRQSALWLVYPRSLGGSTVMFTTTARDDTAANPNPDSSIKYALNFTSSTDSVAIVPAYKTKIICKMNQNSIIIFFIVASARYEDKPTQYM